MRRFLTALFFLMAWSGAALAQTTPFIIDHNRTDRAPPSVSAKEPLLPPPAAVNQQASVKPFTLQAVNIQGASLSAAALTRAIQPWIGKTMDAASLGGIANDVSAAYGNRGDIALYTVTIPAQTFANGLLRLIVTEGFIEHVDLTGDTKGDLSLVSGYARKLTLEKPLHRSTLQRYLSLIRDIPGLTADAKLLQGSPGGGVRMLLTLARKKQSLKLTLNDAGASLLGRYQGVVDFSVFGLLRQGEETKFSFGTSSVFSRYQYYGISDSQPLDQEGTVAQLALGYLHTAIGSGLLSGSARTAQLVVSHPLIRGFSENLSVSAGLDGVDSRNALLGQLLANEKIRALRLSSAYSLADPKWALSLSANLSQGLDILDAQASQGAESGFEKLVLNAAYNRALGSQWVVRLRAAGQAAFTPLPVSELYALGGQDFGRAFLMSSALGDSALAGSAELGWLPAGLPKLLAGTEMFVFGDDGMTWYRARQVAGGTIPSRNFTLASAGLGLRVPVGAKTRLEVSAANALAADAPATRPGQWRIMTGLSSSF